MTTSREADRADGERRRFGWLSLALGAWLTASIIVISLALDQRLTTDVTLSPYHIPFYLGVLALAVLAIVLVVRARRRGLGWQAAFPAGYGGLGVAAVLIAAWPIVDVGWREGIGLHDAGIERTAAPSRLLVLGGLLLVAAAPLRAALRGHVGATRWQAALSGALVFAVAGAYGGFAPAANLWLENPTVSRQDSSEIWVMNADGSRQTRLIEAVDDISVGDPVWSPDGTRLAYVRSHRPPRGGETPDVDIWVADADGSDQHVVVAGVGWQWLPHWSPDGQWIVYTVDPPGGPGGSGLAAPVSGPLSAIGLEPLRPVELPVDVWRIRADGQGEPVQLTADASDDRAGVYAPDGQHLLFDSTREGGRVGIYVMRSDGSEVVRATRLGNDWGGTWSPDGSRIAFHSSRDSRAEDLFVVAWPALGEPTRLTFTDVNELRPNWSPDGTRIAFDANRDDAQDVWSIAADGSDPVNLSRTLGADEWLPAGGGGWGPDGRIAYTRSSAPDASRQPIVREDLAVAGVLLQGILASFVVLLVFAVGAPFGAIAVILGLQTSFAVIGNGEWRFVPAAVLIGLLVDLLARLGSPRLRMAVAGGGAAAAVVLAPAVTVLLTTGLFWTPTLVLGVALAAAAGGWALSGVVGPRAAHEAPPTT